MFYVDLVLSLTLALTAITCVLFMVYIVKKGSADTYDQLIQIFYNAKVEVYDNFELSFMKAGALMVALICLAVIMPLLATTLFAILLVCTFGTRWAINRVLPNMLRRRNLIIE